LRQRGNRSRTIRRAFNEYPAASRMHRPEPLYGLDRLREVQPLVHAVDNVFFRTIRPDVQTSYAK